MAEVLKVVQVCITDADKGVVPEFVKGWVCVKVKSGKTRSIDIWDNREVSKQTFDEYYQVCDKLNRAKRHEGKESIESLRQKRNELSKKFWKAFMNPAELSIKDKVIRGGEDSIQYLALYDTDEVPDTYLRLYRTEGRFTKDPLYSCIRFLKADKADKWDTTLHLVLSSDEDPVDIIEKDEDGQVIKSVRFLGVSEPIIRFYDAREIKSKVVQLAPEEIRPQPPIEEPNAYEESSEDVQEEIPEASEPSEETQGEPVAPEPAEGIPPTANGREMDKEDKELLKGASKRPSRKKK